MYDYTKKHTFESSGRNTKFIDGHHVCKLCGRGTIALRQAGRPIGDCMMCGKSYIWDEGTEQYQFYNYGEMIYYVPPVENMKKGCTERFDRKTMTGGR